MKSSTNESTLARMRRLIAESPHCDCGAEAIINERLNSRTYHFCLECRTSYTPVTEADVFALLASIGG